MRRFLPNFGALVLVALLVGAVVWLRPGPPPPAPQPPEQPREAVLEYADGSRMWGSWDGRPPSSEVRRVVKELGESGMPLEQLERTGAVVRTTLDVKAQAAAAAVVGRLVAPLQRGAAVTAVDPASGGVRVYLSLSRTHDLAGGEVQDLGPVVARPLAEAASPNPVQAKMQPLELSSLFAGLASGGEERRTHFVTSVTARDGAVLYKAVEVVAVTTDKAVAERITARLKEQNGCNGTACVPDAAPWAVSYTPALSVAVFVDQAGGAVDAGLSRAVWQEFLAGAGG
ncbi:hypothetical protein [Lentzea sp. NPDC059081]|uniref:hypothetical protein n=1 Tax=Lentzea sp. NPDC059081 TaxID=3346719 RepID=UPI0036CCA0DD